MKSKTETLDEVMLISKKNTDTYDYNKFSKHGFMACSISLWITSLICFQYWYRAAKHLGWWPVYMHPDPKELGWNLYHNIVSIAIFFMVFSAMFWIIFFLFSFFFKEFKLKNKLRLLGSIGFAFCCYLHFGGFASWFLD